MRSKTPLAHQKHAQVSELYAPLINCIIDIDALVFGESRSNLMVLPDNEKLGIEGIHPYEFLSIAHSTQQKPHWDEVDEASAERDLYLFWQGSLEQVVIKTMLAAGTDLKAEVDETLKRIGIVAVRRRVLFRRDLFPRNISGGIPSDLHDVETYLRSTLITQADAQSPTHDDHYTCELVAKAKGDPDRVIKAMIS